MNLFAQSSDSKSETSKTSNKSASIPKEVSTNDRPWTASRHGRPVTRPRTALPLSMQILRPIMCCQDCGADWPPQGALNLTNKSFNDDQQHEDVNVLEKYNEIYASLDPNEKVLKPHVVAPMMLQTVFCTPTSEGLLQEYFYACELYSTQPNAGVMATLRFSMPALRVSGPFRDADILALGELLLRHMNGPMAYVRRLDFSGASKGKVDGKYPGLRSHGALCLAKILTIAKHVEEVRLQRHRIGPYGAAVLFLAAIKNPVLKSMTLRRCKLGEKGGLAFAEIVCPSVECGLEVVDLSANQIGFRGCLAIEQGLLKRGTKEHRIMDVDLEGNLVFQEIMSGVTHGLGLLLGMVGSTMMYYRTRDRPTSHFVACTVYSCSLLMLYTSSTLYHSFFTFQNIKYIFEALDKCAIYILIAGSYTPFLRIALSDIPIWSTWLLLFIWTCCVLGIYVEANLPDWRHKKNFSILMYLSMGWAVLMAQTDLTATLPKGAVHLVIMGGVAYTSGVPFFVRDNNLDHSIWHLFVLTGSLFHWLAIYWYVVPYESCSPVVA